MKNCQTQLIFSTGLVIALIIATGGIVYAQMHSQVLDNTLNNICVAVISIIGAILQRPSPASPTPPPGTTSTTTTSTQPAEPSTVTVTPTTN